MASGQALVDEVRDVTHEHRPAKRAAKGARAETIVVHFAGGMVARLDPDSQRDRTWREVLESLRDAGEPAYVEIDTDTSRITSVLLPRRFAVTAVREAPEEMGLEVELEISHAKHYLRRGQPRFEEMRRELESAHRKKTLVLVTESLDSSAIVDVRAVSRSRKRR